MFRPYPFYVYCTCHSHFTEFNADVKDSERNEHVTFKIMVWVAYNYLLFVCWEWGGAFERFEYTTWNLCKGGIVNDAVLNEARACI